MDEGEDYTAENIQERNEMVNNENLKQQIITETGCRYDKPDQNVFHMLQQREGYSPKKGGSSFGPKQKVHIMQRYIPTTPTGRIFKKYRHRVFCGKFSKDGSIFMSASQDRKIRFYETDTWKRTKEVIAQDVGWSVIDTDYSPDQKWLIYSGWSNYISLVNIVGESETHDSLEISKHDHGFCLFSVKFSPDSNELLGGSNDQCLYIYDLNRKERTLKLPAHDNDINTVSYADADNNNTILSGSDDCLCKVWDRRTLGKGKSAVGIMVGHHQGITHIHSKGDGRYFISNGKDQCIKLWDIRMMESNLDASKVAKASYDYRNVTFDMFRSFNKNENDKSLMTYCGHVVTKTLIRCYFSPSCTTGQKYIYSGSSDGCVYVYDVLSGKVVTKLKGHRGTIRDLSWHPYLPLLVSTSWDATVAKWDYSAQPAHFESKELKNEDGGDFETNLYYY